MPKTFALTFWLILALPVWFFSLVLGWYYHTNIKTVVLETPVLAQSSQIQSAHQFGSSVKGVSTDIQVADARPLIIEEFLKKHSSPLEPHDYWGRFLTELADKYQLDFRLLPAISMQESNLCKKIPQGSYNCLGLGIHSRGTWHFERFEDNFEAAARILRQNYIDKGLVTPDEIQTKYTPGSNGSWEFAVNHFMDVLEKAEF